MPKMVLWFFGFTKDFTENCYLNKFANLLIMSLPTGRKSSIVEKTLFFCRSCGTNDLTHFLLKALSIFDRNNAKSLQS